MWNQYVPIPPPAFTWPETDLSVSAVNLQMHLYCLTFTCTLIPLKDSSIKASLSTLNYFGTFFKIYLSEEEFHLYLKLYT